MPATEDDALYVSPDGSDGGSGSLRHPLATLESALALARQRPASARRIVLRGGCYENVAVDLTADDAGLTLAAADGETPILSGGMTVADWTRENDRLWSAPVPESAAFRMILVNGEARPQARLPEEGRFQHEDVFDVRWRSSSEGGYARAPSPEELTTLHYREGDLGPWLETANAEITLFHQWDESRVGVTALDPTTRAVTLSPAPGHPPGAFPQSHNAKVHDYIVWNVREGLHQPGMWMHDRTANRLVYWPLPEEDPVRLAVVIPMQTSILSLTCDDDARLQDVEITGLTLTACRSPHDHIGGFGASFYDGALSVRGPVQNVRCWNLAIRDVEGWAIKSYRPPQTASDLYAKRKAPKPRRERPMPAEGITVERCRVERTGAGAIQVRGTGCTVADCTVRDVGGLYPSGLGISLAGRENAVLHNDIRGTSYTALHGGGGATRYENNLIRDFMRVMDDGAAIYVFGGKGTVYRGNLAVGNSGTWSSAYYLDEQCEGCTVEKNIALNTGWPSHNHMARDNAIRNNFFIDAGDMEITFMRCERYAFERNLLYSRGRILIHAPEVIASMANNLLWSAQERYIGQAVEPGTYSRQPEEPLALRDGTLAADPGFVDAPGGDYRFRDDSPARGLGIEEIDVSTVGPRRA